jgi:hypothetical protein
LRLAPQFQILDPVIRPIPVPMMHCLVREKRSAQVLFHHDTMFFVNLSAYLFRLVPMLAFVDAERSGTHECVLTILAAKTAHLSTGPQRACALHTRSAVSASEFHLRRRPASERTEMSASSVRLRVERHAARLARLGDSGALAFCGHFQFTVRPRFLMISAIAVFAAVLAQPCGSFIRSLLSFGTRFVSAAE